MFLICFHDNQRCISKNSKKNQNEPKCKSLPSKVLAARLTTKCQHFYYTTVPRVTIDCHCQKYGKNKSTLYFFESLLCVTFCEQKTFFTASSGVRNWCDQVGGGGREVDDPSCNKIRHRLRNPSWVFNLCIKIGYSSAMY